MERTVRGPPRQRKDRRCGPPFTTTLAAKEARARVLRYGGIRKGVGELERAGVISVHQLKYENRSRRISKGAIPSDLKYDDPINYTYDELGTTEGLSTLTYDELGGVNSSFIQIQEIIGPQHRTDAQHFDSAHMSGCKVFLTSDKGDIWSKRGPLYALTGIRVFHIPSEWAAFLAHVQNGG